VAIEIGVFHNGASDLKVVSAFGPSPLLVETAIAANTRRTGRVVR
jgi:hypothetical protein